MQSKHDEIITQLFAHVISQGGLISPVAMGILRPALRSVLADSERQGMLRAAKIARGALPTTRFTNVRGNIARQIERLANKEAADGNE